jgi:hypothetical protein
VTTLAGHVRRAFRQIISSALVRDHEEDAMDARFLMR